MKSKLSLQEYFNFSRKDRIGLIALITLIVLVLFIPDLMHYWGFFKPSPPDNSWITAVHILETTENADSFQQEHRFNSEGNRDKGDYKSKKHAFTGRLFKFDPNTVADADWKMLGVRDKTIHTIRNYLNKGGKFRKPEDLQRVYGLFPDEFDRLAPYISIVALTNSTGNTNESPRVEGNFRKSFRPAIVDLNIADTSSLIALPGIGSKLATRILSFRDKLGGFIDVEQVKETFGLQDSVFRKIKPFLSLTTKEIKQINVNTATLEELKAHPYIRYAIANAIIAYRKEHGNFKSILDIKNIMAVTPAIFQKISFYITVE